ncbi:hypothetical protein [Tsukamurella ocularis]|uniref:hypothetical protein n=1 Tax=Tsukamurella ocularis TaxID=1970234 RepID=UPI0021688A9E|nr:hypothetical protein [Tsukamurella ocularis]MCS3779086.1 hypothetical protein [Tsukamurella ocularis]MCS3787294.1 hypothetical protein [Tsukamurella ocularis]MCS3851769.1 hypothetical protein [Tsukamurella ocularis]
MTADVAGERDTHSYTDPARALSWIGGWSQRGGDACVVMTGFDARPTPRSASTTDDSPRA